MAENVETALDRTQAAMTGLRKQLKEIEAARGSVTALLTAAARGDENMAAQMTSLIADSVGKLAGRVASLQISMDVVSKAVAPEPAKTPKAAAKAA